MTMTFAEEIEKATNGDLIEAVVIGQFGWSYDGEFDSGAYGFDKNMPIPNRLKKKPINWSVARPYLDYEYDRGFGAPNCHAIVAYTKNWILFVGEYDGSTGIEKFPRNPTNFEPKMV